eukprot:COSAG01_NODE_4493_length_4977_cov_332.394208_5_plen_184_part_00
MGIGPISDPGNINAPQQGTNQQEPLSLSEKAFNAAKDLSDEIGSGAVSKDKFGKTNKKEGDLHQERLDKQEQKDQATARPVDAAAAAAAAQDELDIEKKKRKKRKDKEAQLLAMGKLEGCFETANLDSEEKEVIEEFFQNLNIFKKLKQKLGFEEERHDKYKSLLKKKKALEKLKEQNQKGKE